MTSRPWDYAQPRGAVMVEGKEGLREWKEAVPIFPSEDNPTAFQQALEIRRLGEYLYREGRRSKYPPAEPGALRCEPLKAANAGSLTRPRLD